MKKDAVTKCFRIEREIVEFLEARGYRITDLARMGVIDMYRKVKLDEGPKTIEPKTVKLDHACEICGDSNAKPFIVRGITRGWYCPKHYYEHTGIVIEGWNDQFVH